MSAHGLAEGLVHDAERRGLRLTLPENVVERPGQGVDGLVGGRRVTVGSAAWLGERGIARGSGGAHVDGTGGSGDVLGWGAGSDSVRGEGGWFGDVRGRASTVVAGARPGRAVVHVALDGREAGVVVMADRVRDDARAAVAALHAAGVRDVAMATGDRREVAEAVAASVGLDRVFAELAPEDKLALVRHARERPVVMVGDGVNDAPALALADVGVAMGTAGASASAEAADAVIVVDRLDRLAEAMRLSRRALRIARQSVIAGMGLSLAAMAVAATGHLPPLAGAILQEGIDVAVILNALRALRG